MRNVTQTVSRLAYSDSTIGVIESIIDTSHPYRKYRVYHGGTSWYATSDESGSFEVKENVVIKGYAANITLLIGHMQTA